MLCFVCVSAEERDHYVSCILMKTHIEIKVCVSITFPFFFWNESFFWSCALFTYCFEPDLRRGLIGHHRLMKEKEDKFSRQQFICVSVFVPPSSLL